MTEEIFDVVDERDRPVGRLPRSEVHRLGLRHRAVHVLVFNARGEVFLQKRSWSKDCHPGTWDSSASGHLEAGEDYDDCARREPREEIGLALPETPECVLRVDACEATGMEFVRVYRCRAEGPFELHPEEIETGGWFAADALDAWLRERPEEFAPAFRLIWKLLGEAGAPARFPLAPPPEPGL